MDFQIKEKSIYESLIRYQRRTTSVVDIGGVPLGGDFPIRLQSMTSTDTADTLATVRQIIKIVREGADYVRLTVPGKKEAENLKYIQAELTKLGCHVPIIADIHFNPNVAHMSAEIVDKVRVNPGNFVDKKQFDQIEYTDESYAAELKILHDEFLLLVNACKIKNTALRIGTNHGSLSDRIMSRFGDTPLGMAVSAMEFLRICQEQNFHKVVVSMKASNTRVMVYATRLLVKMMEEEGMNYPVHLGVTEAGEGEDGRIKSAVGIGTLLADGIGETIRVSLTEDPELEIPVGRKLVEYITQRENHKEILEFGALPIDLFSYNRRNTHSVRNIGHENIPVVIFELPLPNLQQLKEVGWIFSERSGWMFTDRAPDYLLVEDWPETLPYPENRAVIFRNEKLNNRAANSIFFYYQFTPNIFKTLPGEEMAFIEITASQLDFTTIDKIKDYNNLVIILSSDNENHFADQRSALFRLMNKECMNPVILKRDFREDYREDFQIKTAADLGGLFIDGLGDGIWLVNDGKIDKSDIISTEFGILQASRVRVSKTEFISCPSCGRTLFDLQLTTKKIHLRTSHLKGLKIGIMGCIVNGPGEMADADYGYVGTGKGRITLYKQKDVIRRNVPETEAVDELIGLIKENGDWIEP